MADPTPDDLDGLRAHMAFDDDTVIRVGSRRTDSDAYPSGWSYTFHYGYTDIPAGTTLEDATDDGTIRRLDNSHEDTKGHELHVQGLDEPIIVRFDGIVAQYRRFWTMVPKPEFVFGIGDE